MKPSNRATVSLTLGIEARRSDHSWRHGWSGGSNPHRCGRFGVTDGRERPDPWLILIGCRGASGRPATESQPIRARWSEPSPRVNVYWPTNRLPPSRITVLPFPGRNAPQRPPLAWCWGLAEA